MKYKNTYNGLLYWIENGLVIYGTDEVQKVSGFTPEDIEAMVKDGKMIPITEFREMVMAEKARQPQYQLRYLAFVVDKGGDAFKGNTAVRNAAFMAWISDIKKVYVERNGHKVKTDYHTGEHIIIDSEHFTDFIISGEWRK